MSILYVKILFHSFFFCHIVSLRYRIGDIYKKIIKIISLEIYRIYSLFFILFKICITRSIIRTSHNWQKMKMRWRENEKKNLWAKRTFFLLIIVSDSRRVFFELFTVDHLTINPHLLACSETEWIFSSFSLNIFLGTSSTRQMFQFSWGLFTRWWLRLGWRVDERWVNI